MDFAVRGGDYFSLCFTEEAQKVHECADQRTGSSDVPEARHGETHDRVRLHLVGHVLSTPHQAVRPGPGGTHLR